MTRKNSQPLGSKPLPVEKGTVGKGDAPFPWMIKGAVSQKRHGTCNVVVVVPHGFKGDDDNAELLGCFMAQFLDSYAVINNQKHDRSKLDLNLPAEAIKCDEYWQPLIGFIKEINQKHGQEALVFVMHGMGEERIKNLKPIPDIVIGKGFIGAYDPAHASASPEFLTRVFEKLKLQGMGAVRDDVLQYSGRSKLPAHMYRSREKLGIKIQAVQVEVRYTGYRDENNIERRGYEFGEAIESLSHFRFWEEDNMAKNEVSLVDQSKLKAILDELRKRKTIKDDKGEDIDFTEALKASLVGDIESAYPVLASALGNIYDTGRFLFEVRERQKKNRLWMSFQEIVGMRKSATNNYIRVYEGFLDRLPEYGHLGVSKLQAIARLKEPFAFLEAHKDEVEKADVRSVTTMVQAEVKAKRKKREKKETTKESKQVNVGSYRDRKSVV